jgi:hypothetical protein
MIEEIWKDVVGYEGLYEVSNLGMIRNKKRNKILSPKTHRGYFRVGLSKNNFVKYYSIHRLVAIAFLSDSYDENLVVDHINNVKKDNRADNLQFITKRENKTKDAVNKIQGYHCIKQKHPNAKYELMIGFNDKKIYLGSFDTKERASIAYDFALRQLDSIKEIML